MATDGRGGKRANAGRKVGSKTQLYAMRDAIETAHPGFSLGAWLVSVVKDAEVPISVRVQAATTSMKYMYVPAQPDPEPLQTTITSFEVIEYSADEIAEYLE